MKRVLLGFTVCLLIASCQESDSVTSEFTGNETVYSLQQGSDYDINGTATFREKLDGTTLIVVELSGSEGNIEHPVHLHMGDITTPAAEVAALLTPVVGSVGKSETTLKALSDETRVTYKELLDLKACIKIHLSAIGPDRDIILAGGNVGAASTKDIWSGRAGFSTCKSE